MGAVLLLLAVGVRQVLQGPLLRLHHLAVVGARQRAPWLQWSGLAKGTLLLGLDLSRAEARLLAHDPWLAAARYTYAFPDGLVLHLRYRVFIAAVAGPGGAVYVVDREGMVLPGGADSLARLPLVAGEVGKPTAFAVDRAPGMRDALAVLARVPPSLQPEVAEVRVSGGAVTLLTVGGTGVLLGPPVHVGQKLDELAALLPELAERGVRVRWINLLDPARPSLVR